MYDAEKKMGGGVFTSLLPELCSTAVDRLVGISTFSDPHVIPVGRSS